MSTLTSEQQLDIIKQSQQANAVGDHEAATRILKKLPVAPHLAMAAKEIWGKEFLINGEYDLSEAEAEYGANWLNR